MFVSTTTIYNLTLAFAYVALLSQSACILESLGFPLFMICHHNTLNSHIWYSGINESEQYHGICIFFSRLSAGVRVGMASLFGWLWLEGRRCHGGVYLSVLNSEAFGRFRHIMKRSDFVVHLVFLQHGTLATLQLIDPLLLFTSLEWLQATYVLLPILKTVSATSTATEYHRSIRTCTCIRVGAQHCMV